MSDTPDCYVRVFGGIRIDGPKTQKLGSKVRDMLACLTAYAAVYPGQSLTRDLVSSVVWPEEDEGEGRYPTNLKASFNNASSALRRALQGKEGAFEPLPTDREHQHIRLETAVVDIDVVRFRQAYMASNSAANHNDRIRHLEEAAHISRNSLPDRYLAHKYLRNLFEQLLEWQFKVRYQLVVHYIQVGNREQALAYLHLAREIKRTSTELDKLLHDLNALPPMNRAYVRIAPTDEQVLPVIIHRISSSVLDVPKPFLLPLRPESRGQSGTETLSNASDTDVYRNIRTVGADIMDKPTSNPNNLPPDQATFIGRKSEREEIARYLLADSNGLVTVTGPGGSGKTRVIIKLAKDMISRFEDGVWLAQLARVTDSAGVLHAIAGAAQIEIKASDTAGILAERLKPKRMLLVLDNCEHLSGPCAEIAGTIHSICDNVAILASSRAPLGVYGERPYPLPPMSLPDPATSLSPTDLAAYDATLLFLERAKTAKPGFVFTESSATSVAWICRRLEGIPLAIELAAAWMRSLTVQEISDTLKSSFALLNMPNTSHQERHGTLRAVIGSSYELLSREEEGQALQALFRRLSVFVGGWTNDAAKVVCAEEDFEDDGMTILKLMTSLLDMNLIEQTNEEGTSRYRMLETVREYGLEKLRQNGELAEIRSRHLHYYVSFAWDTNVQLRGAKQMRQFDIFDKEYPNILTGIEWCLGSTFLTSDQPVKSIATNLEQAAELLSALSRFLGAREHYSQVRKLFDTVISAGRAHAASLTWANLYHEAGGLARMQGEYNQARYLYMEGLRIRDAFCDRQGIARSIYCIGLALSDEGRYPEAQPFFQCALNINRYLGTEGQFYFALCLNGLGNIARQFGKASEAESQLVEALAIMRQLRDGQGIALVHFNLAYLALSMGALDEASDNFLAALAIEYRIGDRPRIAEILEGFATLGRVRNTPEFSIYLYALAAILREDAGMPVPRKDTLRIKRDMDALRTELGEHEVGNRLRQVDNYPIEDELNRCCEVLRAEHPNTWDDALRPLELSPDKARRPAPTHLLVSLDGFLKSQKHPQQVVSDVDQADNTVDILQPSAFMGIGASAFESGNFDLANAYYSIELELARQLADDDRIEICLQRLKELSKANHQLSLKKQ